MPEAALAYLRVSTLHQADAKNLEGQLEAVQAYCAGRGYEIAHKTPPVIATDPKNIQPFILASNHLYASLTLNSLRGRRGKGDYRG